MEVRLASSACEGVGVHTGDSIVIAPAVTLADKEYQMLRSAALSPSVVSAASAVTAAKTLLMYTTVLIVVFLIIRAIVKKFRKPEEKKEQ